MWRRGFFLGFLVPVLTFASTGCFLTDGATKFIADATIASDPGFPLPPSLTPAGYAFVRFFYLNDTQRNKLRIKGHYKDPARNIFMKLQGVLIPGQGPQFSCMGAIVAYVVENPNHPHTGDIVDMDGHKMMPAITFDTSIDACDNNHDGKADMGDTFDIFNIDGPADQPQYFGYTNKGTVVDGKFECEAPAPCEEQPM